MIRHRTAPGRLRTPSAYRQRGQSATEFLVVVPVLLLLILGIVQMVLLYRAKATLDYAALEAARAGAVHGARMDEMHKGLKQGLMPLYTTSKGAAGLAKARLALEQDFLLHKPRIEVISPTRAAWNDHRERQHDGRWALPNDNLAFRSRSVGSASGMNVQDANILKIKVTYEYPLIVPFVDRVLAGLSRVIRSDSLIPPTELTADNSLKRNWSPWSSATFRLPIESTAIVRMQSPIHEGAL
ncbi:TadE/TadG family type IV pilus assembly protein [Luteimonas sp. e5]